MKKYGLSGIFKGNIMGENMDKDVFGLNSTGFDLEKNMKKGMTMGLDKVAIKRMKNQKKVSLFGDYDNDKLMNVFDCEPLNKKKQGMIHKSLNLFGGRGFKEDADLVKNEGYRTRVIKSGKYTDRPDSPISTLEELKRTKVGKIASYIGAGAKNLFEKSAENKPIALARTKEQEEINQIQSGMKEDAYQKMIRRKAREGFMDEYLTNKQASTSKQGLGQIKDSFNGMRAGGSEAARQLIGGTGAGAPDIKSKINNLYGVGNSGGGFAMMASGSQSNRGFHEAISNRQGTGMYEAIKHGPTGMGIIESLQSQMTDKEHKRFTATPIEQNMNPVIEQRQPIPAMEQRAPRPTIQQYAPQQPVGIIPQNIQQQPVGIIPQNIQQQNAPQQNRIISPYSKKAVGYTRGPYRKRVEYQQYPQ